MEYILRSHSEDIMAKQQRALWQTYTVVEAHYILTCGHRPSSRYGLLSDRPVRSPTLRALPSPKAEDVTACRPEINGVTSTSLRKTAWLSLQDYLP